MQSPLLVNIQHLKQALGMPISSIGFIRETINKNNDISDNLPPEDAEFFIENLHCLPEFIQTPDGLDTWALLMEAFREYVNKYYEEESSSAS